MNEPYLRQITFLKDQVPDWNKYPFNIDIVKNFTALDITQKVTFFIGENGSGKSTFLEAIAGNYGFGKEGGSRSIATNTSDEDTNSLSEYLRLSWSNKLLGGYFFRAETFFNLATYVDEIGKEDKRMYNAYGGESLHKKSHGQSFLILFTERFSRGGFYLMDEPEAALSPQRQLSLMVLIHNMIKDNPNSQFIIATHSPILLAYPEAQILAFNGEVIEEVAYEETEVYQLTKTFLNNPSSYLKRLLEE